LISATPRPAAAATARTDRFASRSRPAVPRRLLTRKHPRDRAPVDPSRRAISRCDNPSAANARTCAHSNRSAPPDLLASTRPTESRLQAEPGSDQSRASGAPFAARTWRSIRRRASEHVQDPFQTLARAVTERGPDSENGAADPPGSTPTAPTSHRETRHRNGCEPSHATRRERPDRVFIPTHFATHQRVPAQSEINS